MKKFVYEHGLPFSKILGINIKDLLNRIDINKASLAIVDGGVGEGKTTLGTEVADFVNKENNLHPIKLEIKQHPQLAQGGEAFLKQLRICYEKNLPVIVYDEAGDFNRRGALTRFNAMINRTFETYRAFKILVILCLPSFGVLDNEIFLKGIPRLLLHLDKRNIEYGYFRGYSLYRMMYIKDRMKKLVVKNFAYDLVEPNFRGNFLDLEPHRIKQLDRLTTKGKIDALKKAEIKIEGLINYNDISQKVGRSVVWVRVACSRLRIKPKRLIHRIKYFDNEVINRLADFMDEGGLTNDKSK